MKKILTIIIALTLVLVISGCDEQNWEDMSDFEKVLYCGKEENLPQARCVIINNLQKEYYSRAEVDELVETMQSDIRTALATITVVRNQNYDLEQQIVENELNITELDMNDLNFYTEDELDLLFDELEDYILELEARIEILEGEPIVYTGCNMVSLLWEFGEAIDDGYTLDLVNGNLVEYKNGIATGDIFTNQDLLDDYCTTGE